MSLDLSCSVENFLRALHSCFFEIIGASVSTSDGNATRKTFWQILQEHLATRFTCRIKRSRRGSQGGAGGRAPKGGAGSRGMIPDLSFHSCPENTSRSHHASQQPCLAPRIRAPMSLSSLFWIHLDRHHVRCCSCSCRHAPLVSPNVSVVCALKLPTPFPDGQQALEREPTYCQRPWRRSAFSVNIIFLHSKSVLLVQGVGNAQPG